MKNIFLVIIALIFGSCVSNNANNDKVIHRIDTGDYIFEIIDNGKAAMIYEYRGWENSKNELMIPSKVHRLPVKKIGTRAFIGIGITSVVIPDNVVHIDEAAFFDNLLTSVIIPKNVSHIGYGAFSSNPLVSITIGKNAKLDSNAFDNSFGYYYNNNQRKAGTYIYSDCEWGLQKKGKQ
jgi:hypothetical protein